jgi:hypothetical protein
MSLEPLRTFGGKSREDSVVHACRGSNQTGRTDAFAGA